MQTGLFKRLVVALGNGFGDLADFFDSSNGNFTEFASHLGYPGLTLPPAYQALVAHAITLRAKVANLVDEPSYEQLGDLSQTIVSLVVAIEQAASSSNTSANNSGTNASLNIDWVSFSEQLAGTLTMAGLRRYLPTAYHYLSIVGVFTGTGNFYTVGDNTYETRAFNLTNFKALLNQPATYLAEYFGWGIDFRLDSDMQADLMSLLEALGTEPTLINAPLYSPPIYDQVTNPEGRDTIFLPFKGTIGGVLNKILSVSLFTISSYGPDVEWIEETDPQTGEVTYNPATGPYDEFVLNLLSDEPQPNPIIIAPNLTLQFVDLRDALRFRIGPDGINFTNGSGLDLPTLSINRVVVLTYKPDEPLIFIGEPGRTRLEADTLELALDLSVTQGARLTLQAINCRLTINGSEGDSFLSRILPASIIQIPLSVSLSSKEGLRLNTTNSFSVKVPKDVKLGPVQFRQLTIGIASSSRYDLIINAGADVIAELGPVTVSASNTGAFFSIAELAKPKDLAFGFKLPSGIGIHIDSDAVSGGGYLFIDALNHQYAGVASLNIKDVVKVNALGLLQTKLPNNRPGYSLLLLITAEFTPIQLGLGFTLNGLGGLVGIHRTINVPFLRSLVQAGGMSQLLFPANVLANAPAALALADNAFPAAEGRYVFGLMAKIGWGSPTLITLDVGLIIELPSPIRLVLLGVLRAVLPDERSPIIRLRADFLGVIDFGAKRISFDASLVDSRVLQFVLTGDAAFRLYQGDKPVFILTSGGFHPAFQPPANADLPTLRRLTLALAQGNDFRLTLSSYLAVTANTVQFGSRLDLYVGLVASYYLEGFLSFDALFKFNPFYLQVQVAAGVAIKKGGSSKLSISLSLLVSGPSPWHVTGEGSFKILFIKIKFRVDRTFGGSVSQPTLPATNVRDLLRTALQDSKNWEVTPPATRAGSTVVLRTETEPSTLVIEPGGALVVRQKVVPLGYPLQVYGNAQPVGGNQFDISQVALGESNPLTVSGSALAAVQDQFSPGQLRRMSDGEKLSAPSFQLMRSGVRLAAASGLTGGGGTTRTVQFEQKIISAASADNTAGRQTGTSTYPVGTAVDLLPAPLPGTRFNRLARTSAVSRDARSYEQRRPSRQAPDQVKWDEDTYHLVSVRDLLPYKSAPNPFANEAEASAYLTTLVQTTPALLGELQVVPSYQLALSAQPV